MTEFQVEWILKRSSNVVIWAKISRSSPKKRIHVKVKKKKFMRMFSQEKD